ncbi:uncharacterized protein BXZ73DRAFT_105668 [Epithele typhae]|uniref:uncharacterized protein n=1 Tax=Epithele typhae TaxID=378194 RepID=UPI0020081488|nr:uncharacterized protein BXZ73DRAFT_105668 [Epithele typhae]KAH9916974.1 hypothetical protein BXZ73DRAFT_105668 [Epithele typhae]
MALALKEKGNTHFKAGNFAKYARSFGILLQGEFAESADRHDPVYPSNLSASLYEEGNYSGAVDAILRAWNVLKDRPGTKQEVIARLSTRLAKALAHGFKCGTIDNAAVGAIKEQAAHIESAASAGTSTSDASTSVEHPRVWEEWASLSAHLDDYDEKAVAGARALSRLPILSKPIDPTQELYDFGHDHVYDLMQGWGADRIGPPRPLNIDYLKEDRLAFLYGGVGDGRHVYGTLSGLHATYRSISKARQAKFRAHLTLLDIHEVPLARNLSVLMLLLQLNDTSDKTERAEINATLMYTFAGVIMPPYCHDRLHAVFRDLRRRLSASPPDLPPIFQVLPDSIPPVLRTLDFWINTKRSTAHLLSIHDHVGNSGREPTDGFPGEAEDWQVRVKSCFKRERDDFRRNILAFPDSELVSMEFVPSNVPKSRVRQWVKANLEQIVDEQLKHRMDEIHTLELRWYSVAKSFVPPLELFDRTPVLADAWKEFDEKRVLSSATKKKDTKFGDPELYPFGNGYPGRQEDIFSAPEVLEEFCHEQKAANRRTTPMPCFDDGTRTFHICSAFFSETAAAIKALQSRLTLEFVHGGLPETLSQMRVGALKRPGSFPSQFTRMWMSNVPDYTHGPLNMIVYATPSLQNDPQASLASNCLLNTSVWSSNEEFFHTYTHLFPEEMPRYLGCRMMDAEFILDQCVLGYRQLPLPLSALASRDNINVWLTRVLFHTLIPGHTQELPRTRNVRLPHNIVAFFGLLAHLQRVGYPAHWLSDFISRVLSGSMTTNIVPYDSAYPIPVTARHQRVNPRRVRTDPWLIEFETIIAIAQHALPFPILSTLPPHFACPRDPEDIALWEAPVQATPALRKFVTNDPFADRGPHSPFQPCARLLVYRADAVRLRALVEPGAMRRVFEGAAGAPAPGALLVLTALERVHFAKRVRFRMSRGRVAGMRGAPGEKWCAVLVRGEEGLQVTLPVPVQDWVECAE